jgi:predicted ATP-grasp superfamily ATP-dependent carboligase
MRILAYEHFTALGGRAPASLRVEGGAMLTALAADLSAAGHAVTTFAGSAPDAGWAAGLAESGARIERGSDLDPLPALLADVEAAWVVAPETGGELASLSRKVLSGGRRLLGSTPVAVALAASKLETCRTLCERGIRTVPSVPLTSAVLPRRAREWSFPLVVKPVDGVGSEGVSLVTREGELDAAWRRATGVSSSVLVQPFVEGDHASVSLLIGPAGVFPLALQSQDVTVGASFGYGGGRVPLESPHADDAVGLARAASDAIPGLAGFVGVDLVLSADGPVVIEVNPRLTTAYLGLRRAVDVNLADLALGVLDGSRAEVRIERTVAFSVSGAVEVLPGRRPRPARGGGRRRRQVALE